MDEKNQIRFIKKNWFIRVLDLFVLLVSCYACISCIGEIYDNFKRQDYYFCIVSLFYFLAFIFLIYMFVMRFNETLGFSSKELILHRRKRQSWQYTEIDWFSVSYGKIDSTYGKVGNILSSFFSKPIMANILFYSKGRVYNLNEFSGKELRSLVSANISSDKLITNIEAQHLLSENNRWMKLNNKMSNHPFSQLILAILAISALVYFVLNAIIE